MKILKLAIFLAVISAASGLCLSYVNDLTAPVIEEIAMQKETAVLQEIFPDASFEKLEVEGTFVTGAYQCEEGTAYKISTQGYGGKIQLILGIDNDGKFIGFNVTDCSSETSGFGSKVGEDEFKQMVLTKDVDTQIDLISGATISSTAVQKGIDEASSMYKNK